MVYSTWEVWIWINMDANVWSFGAVFFVSNHSKWRCMMKELVNGPVKSKMMKTSGSIWERRHHRIFAIVSVVCFLWFPGVEELFQFTWQEDTDQKKPKKEKKTTKVGWKVEANERVVWLSASLERIPWSSRVIPVSGSSPFQKKLHLSVLFLRSAQGRLLGGAAELVPILILGNLSSLLVLHSAWQPFITVVNHVMLYSNTAAW